MRTFGWILLLLPVLLFSCKGKQSASSVKSLQVDLDSKSAVGWKDLFSRLEVTPLETNDSCLLMSVGKIVFDAGVWYVFDNRCPALYVFGSDGHFIRQISRRGQGPGEYSLLVDFALDPLRKEILLLSPFGYCLVYGWNGEFIRRVQLPDKPNYHSLAVLQDGNYALWSCVEAEEEGITLVDAMGTYLKGYWHNDRMVDILQLMPFYTYAGRAFFTTAFDNPVYEITVDTLKPSYQWDFGDKNVDTRKLASYLAIENPSEKNRMILQALDDGTFPFTMEAQYANSRYCYVALRPGIGVDRPLINVFYDKKTDHSFVFEKVREGFSVCPVDFTDTFVLSLLRREDFHYLKDFLPAAEYASLEDLDEESNPCLLRLYFK